MLAVLVTKVTKTKIFTIVTILLPKYIPKSCWKHKMNAADLIPNKAANPKVCQQ